MPAIKTIRENGNQLEKVLQDALNTEPNEWNYFFEPHRIKEVLEKLACQIKNHNFFILDYSINTFLDFLKAYIKANLSREQLNTISADILQIFNQIIESLHEKIISHTAVVETFQSQIISKYIAFLGELMEVQHRSIFNRSEISMKSADLQAIAGMLKNNSASINDNLIEKYISLLKLSFDIPKFLTNYDLGLGINPLAEACFLNNNISTHIISTKFFDLLGYQGQILDYYKNAPGFNITDRLLTQAKHTLNQNALNLQQFFFDHLKQRDDIDKPLLQHYLYVHFFKVIYKEYPDRLEALKTNGSLSDYVTFDYVALPNSLICSNFPIDDSVRVEYANLSEDKIQLACIGMRRALESYEKWKLSLGLNIPNYQSDYIFRIGDSFKKYSFTYAYGELPRADGFYRSTDFKHNTFYGNGYSYFSPSDHQVFHVAGHEFIHHYIHKINREALSVNKNITRLVNLNFNEGLAELFSLGACAPDHVGHDFKNTPALHLPTLLNTGYVGYTLAWLYNNYLVQHYPGFYRELLSVNKDEFKARWTPILDQNQWHFSDWSSNLKENCKNALTEFNEHSKPSLYLKDYLPSVELKATTIKISQPTLRKTMPQTTSRTTATVRSTKQTPVLSTTPAFYDDYLSLMHAIHAKNATEIDRILQHNTYQASDIVNYQNPKRGLETPLHFLFAIYRKSCPDLIIQKFCRFGALPNLIDNRNETAYMMAENCDNWPKIQAIFDNQIENLKKTTENKATGLIPYSPKEYPLVINMTIPILATINGSLSGIWNQIAERFPRLDNIIFYALKPISMAMTNAIMNMLFYRRLSYISSEDSLVFCYYLGMNYIGMLSNQFGKKATKNIQNIYSKFFLQSLLNTFFTNPSLLGHLTYEGIQAETYSLVLWPMLSMIVGGFFFQAGEWATQKVIGKFFPVNSPISFNDSKRSYLGYSLGGTPKDMSSDLKKLEGIKGQLDNFETTLKKHVDKQAYILSFENNMTKTKDNLLELLRDSENNQELDRDNFNDFKENLINIQTNLKVLLNKGKSKPEIKFLWDQITKILPLVSEIHPLPPLQVNSRPDFVVNHGNSVTIEEEQSNLPLMSSFNNTGHTNKNYQDNNGTPHYQVSSKLRRISSLFSKIKSDLPAPPTKEQLLEMGIINVEKPRIA
ncbi:hypothetical protein [Rickettsiella endosymbiont of Aleochara curtula]|uniref:hypothetical protein n=1 Tax=Rickettsiella endosymbiont of Aleochara curtula TaxID=3077936 RepID=UPI00313D2451